MTAGVYLTVFWILYYAISLVHPAHTPHIGGWIVIGAWLLFLDAVLWMAGRRSRRCRFGVGLTWLVIWLWLLERHIDPYVGADCCCWSTYPMQDALAFTCLTAVLSASLLQGPAPVQDGPTGIHRVRSRSRSWAELVLLLAILLPAWGAYFGLRMYCR